MQKILITQAILWAAAIIATTLVAPSENGWLILTLLATGALGTLKSGIESIETKNGKGTVTSQTP
jgi:hypothetical protein